MGDFQDSQKTIGAWSLKTFGAMAADFHAARMIGEMADVFDCIAKGDMDQLGRAVAGVFVVAFALSESQGIDLWAALQAEHDENRRSHWVKNRWGQAERSGDGSVPDTAAAAIIGTAAASGLISPKYALQALCDLGAFQSQAIRYLVSCGVSAHAFDAPSPIDPAESDSQALTRLEAEKQARIAALAPPALRLFQRSFVGGIVTGAQPEINGDLITEDL